MRTAALAAAALLTASPALAQHEHHMPAADPAPADPHAGHDMSAMKAAPGAADPHAGHAMGGAASAAVGNAKPPVPPTDHAADKIYDPADMAAARRLLRREHGAMPWSKVMLETGEYRPAKGGDGFGWEGQASFGGDVNRFMVKTEGEGEGSHVETAELQGLYSRAIGPYYNLQVGVRQDFEPRSRTYLAAGVQGVAPYWFEIDASAFLSDKGDLTARFEGAYDFRITQRLIFEPKVEVNVSAQRVPSLRIGAGLTDIEGSLRLRYNISQRFSPYIGVLHEHRFGKTADYARADGGHASETRFVVGLRAWF
jgi:copper resistance protein B